MRRVAIGCGGLLAAFIVFGIILSLIGLATRPKSPEFGAFQQAQSFEGMIEPAQQLGADGSDRAKPVRLVIDVEMARFKIRPHDLSREIRIDSEYDKVNFDLKTDVVDKGDHIEYRLRFKNKRTILGMIFSEGGLEDDDFRNRITLFVPKDLLLSLDYRFSMGEADYDFSGLALGELVGDFSIGEFKMRMTTPNQVRLKKLELKSNMSEVHIRDLQNFRYTNGDLRHTMGEYRLLHSGPYEEDAKLRVKMSMGEVRVSKPPGTNFDQSLFAMMGGVRQTRGEKADPNLATLSLSGKVTMGEFRTTRSGNDDRAWSLFLNQVQAGDTDEVINTYLEQLGQKPGVGMSEGDINRVGYTLMRRDLNEKARAVFQLNIRVHPDYINGYDSLGDAHFALGDYQQAADSYQKAIDLTPEGGNVRGTHKKLVDSKRRQAESQTTEQSTISAENKDTQP